MQDKDVDDDENRPAKRVKLGGTSNGGWLQAAPSDPKKRRVHARSNDEIKEAYSGDSHELHTQAAATEWAPLAAPPPTLPTRRRRDATGPNFKAFRKNRVPPVHVIEYQWKTHRSVPAVQKAKMEEEQRAADEQFRRANELFKDVAVAKGGRRRRLQ